MADKSYTAIEKLRSLRFFRNHYGKHEEIPIELIPIFSLYMGNTKPENVKILNRTTVKSVSNQRHILGGILDIGKGEIYVWWMKFTS